MQTLTASDLAALVTPTKRAVAEAFVAALRDNHTHARVFLAEGAGRRWEVRVEVEPYEDPWPVLRLTHEKPKET